MIVLPTSSFQCLAANDSLHCQMYLALTEVCVVFLSPAQAGQFATLRNKVIKKSENIYGDRLPQKPRGLLPTLSDLTSIS